MNDAPATASVSRTSSNQDHDAAGKPAGPCAMVIFGASGDLTQRKLLPALVNLARDNLLPRDFAVIGLARRPMSDQDFRRKMGDALREADDLQPDLWEKLQPRLFYLSGDLHEPATFAALRDRLQHFDREFKTAGNYLFYLSTAPDLFGPAIERLGESSLTK